MGMVARDGIEPPTPAFSGPRSTTELSGLSANFHGAIFCAGSSVAEEMGEYLEFCAQKTASVSIATALPYAKPEAYRQTAARDRGLHYTEEQSCDLSPRSLLPSLCFWPPAPIHLARAFRSPRPGLHAPFSAMPTRGPWHCARFWLSSPKALTCTSIFPARCMQRHSFAMQPRTVFAWTQPR